MRIGIVDWRQEGTKGGKRRTHLWRGFQEAKEEEDSCHSAPVEFLILPESLGPELQEFRDSLSLEGILEFPAESLQDVPAALRVQPIEVLDVLPELPTDVPSHLEIPVRQETQNLCRLEKRQKRQKRK